MTANAPQTRHSGVSSLMLGLALACSALTWPAAAADAPAATPAQVSARALLKPKAQALLSSEITGRITRLALREGESFHKNDRLVEFDCSWLTAAQAAAQAAVNHAQAKLSSLESLAAMRSAGALEVSLAHADLDEARAKLRAAALPVEHCIITAPFNGRVVELKVHPFESVAQSTPLLTILDDTELDVSLVIPATWLTWLKPGQGFTLVLDETGRSYQAHITRLGAQIDPVSQTVPVFGELTDKAKELVSGMSGNARFDHAGAN